MSIHRSSSDDSGAAIQVVANQPHASCQREAGCERATVSEAHGTPISARHADQQADHQQAEWARPKCIGTGMEECIGTGMEADESAGGSGEVAGWNLEALAR